MATDNMVSLRRENNI